MTSLPDAAQERFAKAFLLLLTVAISIIFFFLVRRFLVAILLAGIFSAMAHPLYRYLLRRFKERKALASVTTLLIVLLGIVIPATGFLGIVATQAVQVSQSVRPWVERQLSQPDDLDRLLAKIPFADKLQPYQDRVAAKVGEIAERLGTFLFTSVGSLTRGTVSFLLQFFVMLYAMFFFLVDGRKLLDRILYYMPLTDAEEHRMVERFVSVTRATVKGSLVIGILQGGLAGVAFWLAGVPGAAFWGTVMVVLSIIPGIGATLIWVPAVIYLAATGHVLAAILLAVWCGAVVGTIDNVLRPRLVGKDTKMSDLLILLSTLGGIFMFGAIGVILGPIVAALFVTIWDIYGSTFKAYLPEVG